jgi:hypothetical protein
MLELSIFFGTIKNHDLRINVCLDLETNTDNIIRQGVPVITNHPLSILTLAASSHVQGHADV